MAKYRLLEIKDPLISNGEPHWRIERKILGLFWSEYFGFSEWGNTFYRRDEADKWWKYYTKEDAPDIKIIAQTS